MNLVILQPSPKASLEMLDVSKKSVLDYSRILPIYTYVPHHSSGPPMDWRLFLLWMLVTPLVAVLLLVVWGIVYSYISDWIAAGEVEEKQPELNQALNELFRDEIPKDET